MLNDGKADIISLTRALCAFTSGIVAEENERLFDRISEELPIKLYRFPSGSTFNGWVVPQLWKVGRALISRDGVPVFDGKSHPLGVAYYSKSFHGDMDLDELKTHLVANPALPSAYMFHCMWQYRPWDAGWTLCVPYDICKKFVPGRYHVDIETTYEDGEMLVGEYEHKGRSSRTIVFQSHTCHPHQANDGFAGVATLIKLFQWLRGQKTYYTYRLVLGPEHLGTVFYLRNHNRRQLKRLVSGIFVEMPGTKGPVKAASTFLGNQPIDKALNNALRHYSGGHINSPWRKGAGNDETVWEAPGYEVPFVEVTRCIEQFAPYPEYHSSLDTPDSLDARQVDEIFNILQKTIGTVEQNAVIYREFNGLLCLSNPRYNLYLERSDPAVAKNLSEDSEKWGHLLDCLLRYFDGSMTILDIAEKHDLPFDRLHEYLMRFKEKGLIHFEFTPIERLPVSNLMQGRKKTKRSDL